MDRSTHRGAHDFKGQTFHLLSLYTLVHTTKLRHLPTLGHPPHLSLESLCLGQWSSRCYFGAGERHEPGIRWLCWRCALGGRRVPLALHATKLLLLLLLGTYAKAEAQVRLHRVRSSFTETCFRIKAVPLLLQDTYVGTCVRGCC